MANEINSGQQVSEPTDESPLKNYVPEGWKSADEFLDHVRSLYDADAGYDKQNREWALEDLKFAAGDQWDEEVKQGRESLNRPCLTINVLPQFIGQVIGDRRLNKTAVKVRPFKDGTQEVADTRSGLIKSIELYSRAERVYDAVCEDQVTCGIGNFRIDMEYAANDVFDQDIFIRSIPNPLAVVWDRMSVDPTGRDARHCFVTDTLPRDVYERTYPDIPCPSELSDSVMVSQGWFSNDVVRLTEFWEMIEKPATFALMLDGSVQDVTGQDPEEYFDKLWRNPVTGETRVRESYRTYARMHLVTGFAIISEAYELPLTRLPIIRAEGRTIRVGDDRVRFGLVRFAKDSQRLKNYWRSVAAETIALAPKAQWIAPSDAVEGREDDFREAHKTGDPLLVFNKNASVPPQRVDPAQVPAALLQEAQMNQQDIKDTTGLHDASLGIRSNEVSGKAIQARQSEGDIATVIYHDNLNHAILEGGDVINQLIPLAYDAIRTVRVIGDDDKHTLVNINDPDDENSLDITVGKYDVVLDTGPSFMTQRMEAQEAMMTLIQTAPDLMGVIGDLVAKNMDWPGAHEIAERLKKTMPPELIKEDEEGDAAQEAAGQPAQPSPEEALQLMQMQEAQAQLEQAAAMREAELATAQAKAAQAGADAMAAQAKARQAEADANAAEARAQQAAIEADMAPQIAASKHIQGLRHADQAHTQKIDLAGRAASAKVQTPNRSVGSRPGGDRPDKGAQKGKNK